MGENLEEKLFHKKENGWNEFQSIIDKYSK